MKRRSVYCVGLVVVVLPFWLSHSALAENGSRGEWRSYHGDLGASQYTPLDQIDAENVARLEVAWRWDSPDNALAEANSRIRPRNFKSTPLMVAGRLFINTSLGQVAAIDAESGKTLWVFDTQSHEAGRPTNLGWNSRGVGYWTDGEEERIFQPSGNATLWALDAKTGLPISTFGDNGKVDLRADLRRPANHRNYTVMSAPLVVGGVVVVGSSISDGPTGKTMPPGDVRAYDVETGKPAWVFHNPPVEGEKGYESWEQGAAGYTGNANVWTNMTADPELGLVYLPFGTPTNDWYGGHRLGDGLFGESVVCVKAATGELVWHYQLVHHGLWDYDIPAAPTLFDLEIDGRQVKGIAVISKQGFTYVFDRVTGEPVWPIEERPVPQSDVPGERTSPTQPFPTKPPPYEYQGISDEILIDFTPELRAEAKKGLEGLRWGPLFTPPSLITEDNAGTVQLPGWGGGANWWGAALDPQSGYLFVPSITAGMVVGLQAPDASRSDFRYIRGRSGQLPSPGGLPLTKPPYGRITAIDLKHGTIAWQIPHGDGIRQQIIDAGIPDPGPVGGRSGTGPLATRTLLFLGQGARTSRVETEETAAVLRAYDKATGKVVHEMPLPVEPSGTPMSYMAGAKQYIAFAFGGGTEAGVMALSLP